jgi:DeoR/GlpR family transcriptional regulator of sugar metabolism
MLSKRHTEIMRMLTDEGTVTISELAAPAGRVTRNGAA